MRTEMQAADQVMHILLCCKDASTKLTKLSVSRKTIRVRVSELPSSEIQNGMATCLSVSRFTSWQNQ